jgi:hypothetical protein
MLDNRLDYQGFSLNPNKRGCSGFSDLGLTGAKIRNSNRTGCVVIGEGKGSDDRRHVGN